MRISDWSSDVCSSDLSYLIVGNSNKKTEAITQLEGKVFAYSDPLSNSGFLIPSTELLAYHHDPSTFFRRSFFTFAHRNVVQAVAAGLADGGAVYGYVWDTIIRSEERRVGKRGGSPCRFWG